MVWRPAGVSEEGCWDPGSLIDPPRSVARSVGGGVASPALSRRSRALECAWQGTQGAVLRSTQAGYEVGEWHGRGFAFDDWSAVVVSSARLWAVLEVRGRPRVKNLEEKNISASDYRVNEQIRSREVRLIGPDGQNIGVVPTSEALRVANEAELDLVEVAPNADPPVCRVLDYGKFLYERAKKDREARRAQAKVEIKEIRLRPKTSEHHRSFKVRDARRWLGEGKKVRVRIRFRGREITYPEIALGDLDGIAEELSDVGSVEQAPSMEGRTMIMTLAPLKAKG